MGEGSATRWRWSTTAASPEGRAGATIGHVSPEAVRGGDDRPGPVNGDRIRLDIPQRKLELVV